MTNQELNRDIKRLHRMYRAARKVTDNQEFYYAYIDKNVRPEFRRLYGADREFGAMNRTSILIMLRLNLLFHFEPLHHFGLHIDLDKL